MDERKRRRHSSRSITLFLPIASLLIILLFFFGTSAFFRIAVIEISGAKVHSAQEVISSSGLELGGNILTINRSNVEDSIRQAMPLINEVNVSRIMPDKILIEVSESIAIAAISHQGRFYIIDSSGRVLERAAAIPRGIIEIRGFTPVEPEEGAMLRPEPGGAMRLQFMVDVLAAIEITNITEQVSYLDVTRIANISFGYLDRFVVVLGGPEGARYKISQLPDILMQAELDPTFDPTIGYNINIFDPSGEWSLTRR